jgi:hypothetical protein
MSDTGQDRQPDIQHQLGQAVVWGSLQDALAAAVDPRTPEWAIRRARHDRKEPEILALLPSDEALVARRRLIAEEGAQRAAELEKERILAARRALSDQSTAFVEGAISRMERALGLGRLPYLHSVVFIGSDFSVGDSTAGLPPRVASLLPMGWEGWEVVSTIPRTTGVPLTNRQGNEVSYGGGLGGMVDGVYVLIRLPITREYLEQGREELADYLEEAFFHERELDAQTESQLQLGSGALAVPVVQSAGSRGSGTVWGIGMSMPMDFG